ncbi:predicted protein [Sparassis crispa]|uniref:Calcium channel YVC1 n=1 Tax=Sparassis crispa TaxID=139825 RepID=A0A401GW67_9APHY|nr:predicted protein [Sparassis crispa]GBE86440.1 predicted protein [Sparassis crispa]
MSEAAPERQPLLRAADVDTTEVYPIIQLIREDVMHNIDIALSYEALIAPEVTINLILPLEEKYNKIQRQGNLSIVFCLLLNRVYFIRDTHLSTAPLSRTRAALCEILAIRTLREHAHNMLELALAVTMSWPVYSGAPPELLQRAREEREEDPEERVGNAIEMAILGQAKRFTNSSACQKWKDCVPSGQQSFNPLGCTFAVTPGALSLILHLQTYKRTPIHFYDPYKAPLLDHYRLKVPAIRSVLEYTNFLVMFVLFIVALEFNTMGHINVAEGIFMIYALGFTLEKVAAMQEHGITLYFKGTWNGFDLAFVTLYCAYAILRLVGVYNHRHWARELGIDFLALIAVLMFPRLAFVTLKNNVMVLSLRAMIVQFVALMCVAAFCFGGFMYAIWTFSRNKAGYSASQVAWWMLDLWFGLDASLFDAAAAIHPWLGPVTIVTYASLSNTLLLTILVSILSHTFSTINDDASAEAMFRRAVSTIEGVKADFLFSYQPPINLVALCILLPAGYILSPRWFHKLNVFMIRLTSFPVLLLIAWYERQAKRSGSFTFYETVSAAAEKVFDTLPRHLKRLTFFEGLSGPDADIDAIFELEDEFEESALDTVEEPTSFAGLRPRRMSHGSRRPTVGRSTPPRSSRKSEQQQVGHPSGPSSSRHRLNSIVTHWEIPQSVSSPLAQIYQPQSTEENFADGQDGVSPSVSYGRRRLSSLHQRSTMDLSGGPGHHATAFKRFPTTSPGSRSGGLSSQPLSESPGQRSDMRSHTSLEQPETAEQIEESQPQAGIQRRLDTIEERQKRIEDLLVQLSERVVH